MVEESVIVVGAADDSLGIRESLSREQCIEALLATHLGRVATTFGPDSRPFIRPVSYVYDAVSSSVVFHSMPGGKLHALLGRRDACFEIDGGEGDGWVWSVIVRGRVETEDRPREIARLEQLVRPVLTIPAEGRWLRIRGEVISGVRFLTQHAPAQPAV